MLNTDLAPRLDITFMNSNKIMMCWYLQVILTFVLGFLMEIIWERDALLIGLMVINHHWKSGMWKPVSLDGNEPQMCVHNGVGKSPSI